MLKSCSGGILQPLCPAVSSDTLQLQRAWKEGRCSFAALSSIRRSSKSATQTELLWDQWIWCPSTLSQNLYCQGPENQMEKHLLYSASLVYGQVFSFEIQVYSTNKPQKLIVLRSLMCAAFILAHSAFPCYVNRVILGTHQRLRTAWDLYDVKFTQHEHLGLKEYFHYPSAVYSLRHQAEKLWYHPEGIVCTCFKVGL